MKKIKYFFRENIYCSLKDISLGLMIASDRELLYGTKGRIYFIEINLLFLHFKIGIIRSGFRKV